MKGYPTTFLELFDGTDDGRPSIVEIEIPIIQRDYAQGRLDDDTSVIRERFLDALVHAATSEDDISLDFVYGDVTNGVLRPLDGQQRLTTLFLLHWYVASRARALDPSGAWLRFSYATRPTAREFSTAIAKHPYPGGDATPMEWITNQPWYVYPWRQDPTIASMLVMLDAIHARLDPAQMDFARIWARLSERSSDHGLGAISFLFLPVDTDLGEELYIKMNSRGKPLSNFEVFKADFDSLIKAADPDRHKHLADSMDGVWADTLWEYEKKSSGDYKIDDEFERYLTFIVEICEWRDDVPDRKWHDKATQRLWPLEERARRAFADPENVHSARNRDFFFHAFDTWTGTDPFMEMGSIFAVGEEGGGPLPLYSMTPDLFGACIARYGADFSAQETLLLFGVLLARQASDGIDSAAVSRRLRTLRNVTAAFLDRDRNMSSYVSSTAKLILDGTLEGLEGFRTEWVADESLKWPFLDRHPDTAAAVHELEDNPLLRGRIMAFELDEVTIGAKARAFTRVSAADVRDLLGAALLSKGDYSRDIVGWNGERRQLGSSLKPDSWTDMLTTGSRENLATIREPLMALLDDVNIRTQPGAEDVTTALEDICGDWLRERETRHHFDWRYYLVRYAGARSSTGNGYFHGRYDAAAGGFRYGKLRQLHGSNYSAYFSDALLRAAWLEGAVSEATDEPSWWRRDNPGLAMKVSGIEIRSADDALEIVLPEESDGLEDLLATALSTFRRDDNGRVLVAQEARDQQMIDAEDRIQLCVRVVDALATVGL